MVRARTLLTCLLLVVAFGGCKKFDLRKGIPWGKGKDGELECPMKVSALWTEAVLTNPTQPAVRGFGGRLMFYASEDGKPVKVAGTLIVYAFDEKNRDPLDVVPDRKFVFTPEQFEKHYSDTKLGHSYSVWLPWGDAQGEKTDISLMVRFEPVQGGVVVGEQSKHLLPGREPAAEQGEAVKLSHRLRNAKGQAQANAAAPGEIAPVSSTKITTTTEVANVVRVPDEPAAASGVQQAAYLAPVSQNDAGNAQVSFAGPAAEQHRAEAAAGLQMNTATITLPPRMGNRMPQAAGGIPANQPPRQMPVSAPLSSAMPAGFYPAAMQPMTTAQGPGQAPAGQAQPKGTELHRPPAAHFAPERRQALGAPISRLVRDHELSGPHPTGQRSDYSQSPGRSIQAPQTAATSGSGT